MYQRWTRRCTQLHRISTSITAVLHHQARHTSTQAAAGSTRLIVSPLTTAALSTSPPSPLAKTVPHAAAEENLQRIRELLQECTNEEKAAALSALRPRSRLHGRHVWPSASQTLISAPRHQVYPAAVVSRAPAPRYRSGAAAIPSLSPTLAHATAEERHETVMTERDSIGDEDTTPACKDGPLCYYGPPPGVIRPVDYFVGLSAKTCATYLHQHYYEMGQPSAPLLRCPACAAQLLSSASAQPGSTADDPSALLSLPRAPVSSRLWLDPVELDRHLSWAHGDQLFTAQELAPYNAQVLKELRFHCGLSTPEESQHLQTSSFRDSGVRGDAETPSLALKAQTGKTTPARLIIAVDGANIELSIPSVLLELLQLPEAHDLFTRVPVAICIAHELFVPLRSKTLHLLYQLTRLHPSSSLHVLIANSSLESGDLLLLSQLSALQLGSPTRAVPPTLLLTRDDQQRQVVRQMYGEELGSMTQVGAVRALHSMSAKQLVVAMKASLSSAQWMV